MATIIWLSLTPSPPQVDFPQSDKVGHFGVYGLLMAWFCLLYPRTPTRALYALGFIGLGIGLEYVQRMTGYRDFEVLDMVADAIGVLLGWAGALIVLPRLLAYFAARD